MIRVLVVEDEPTHARLVERAFEDHAGDVELTIVGSLGEARACLESTPADAVIVDMLLPDGEAFDLLPADGEEARYPAIVVTAHGDEQSAAEAMKAGASDYVVKSPRTLAELPRLVDQALERWERSAEQRRALDTTRQVSETLERRLDETKAERDLVRKEMDKLDLDLDVELRQPLQTAAGLLETAEEEFSSDGDQKVRELLHAARAAVESARRFLAGRLPQD